MNFLTPRYHCPRQIHSRDLRLPTRIVNLLDTRHLAICRLLGKGYSCRPSPPLRGSNAGTSAFLAVRGCQYSNSGMIHSSLRGRSGKHLVVRLSQKLLSLLRSPATACKRYTG